MEQVSQNPYYRRSAISLPHEFFGRQTEMSEIYDVIQQHQSIALIGERRTGKSSILNAISFLREDTKVSKDARFIYVNCLYAEGSPERRFIKHMLNQITEELESESLPPERDSLFEAATTAQRKGYQLTILMDEIDVILDNPEIPQDLFSFFRAWSEGYRIPFVITSREGRIEPLMKARSAGSPFWNNIKPVYVGPFSHLESMQLIETPADRCGQPFTPEDVKWIHDRGGHHPFFLQMAASYAFTQRDADSVRRHTAFVTEADQHFEYLLDFTPGKEVAALTAFLRGEQIDSRIESKLLMKGLLIEEDSGLRIFSVELADKMRARSRASAETTTSKSLVENVKDFVQGDLL